MKETSSTWQKLGDEAVPLRDEAVRREEAERAQRVKLLVGPRPGERFGFMVLGSVGFMVAVLLFVAITQLFGN